MIFFIFLQIEIILSSLFIIWVIDLWKQKSILWFSFLLLTISQIIILLFCFGFNLNNLYTWWPIIIYLFILLAEFWLMICSKKIRYAKEFFLSFKLDWPLLILLLAFFLFAFITLRVGEFSGDGLMYHLPSIASWYQTHNIYQVVELPHYWRNNIWSFYPQNIHLLYLWALELTKNFAYFKIVHYFFLFIASLVVYFLAQEEKFRFSLLAPLSILVTPVILNSAQVGSIDIEIGVLFFAALFFIYKYFNKARTVYLVFSALSFAIVFGSKLNAVVYLLITMVALFFILFLQKKIWQTRKSISLYLVVILLFSFVFSFHFLYTNKISGHSLIYPLNILSKFEDVIISKPSQWLTYLWSDDSYYKISGIPIYNYDAGVGIILASFGVIGAIGSLYYSWRKKDYKILIFILPAIFLSAFLFYQQRPVFTLTRYFIFVFFPLALFVSWLATKSPLKTWQTYSLYGLLVLYSLSLSTPTIFNYTTFSYEKNFYSRLVKNKIDPYSRGDLSIQNHKDQWSWLNDYTINAPATIAPIHQIFTYDLYGYDLQNKVVNIFSTDRADFFNKLKSSKTSLIFLSSLNRQDKSRVIKNGNNFELITDNTNTDQFNVTAEINKKAKDLAVEYSLLDTDNGRYYIGVNGMQQLYSLSKSGKFIFKLNGMNVKTLGFFVFDQPKNKLTMAHLGINIKSVTIDDQPIKLDFRVSDYPLEYYWVNNLSNIFDKIYQSGEVYVYKINQTFLD